MGRSVQNEKSAKVELNKIPQESSAASDEGSEPSSTRCSCVSSSTASTHYRDFSTMSSSTRERLSQNDDQFVIQNMFNKRSERLRKPCQNGFCYCFTSDSDELRFVKNKTETRTRPKHKRSQSDKIEHIRSETGPIQKNVKGIESKSTRRITLPPSTEIKLRCDPRDNDKCCKHNPRHTFVSKYALPEPLGSEIDEPLVRIIQEIHRSFVISKISVNRGKISSRKKGGSVSPSAPTPTTSTQIEEPDKIIHIETRNIENPEKIEDISPLESNPHDEKKCIDTNAISIPIKPPRSPKKKGGHLLRKRIGDSNNVKQPHIQTPPRKPPRSFSSCSESNIGGKNTTSPTFASSGTVIKETGNVKGQENIVVSEKISPHKLSNTEKTQDPHRNIVEQPSPSCPSMSEITFVQSPSKITNEIPENQIGWVRPDIANMLNYESHGEPPKQFQSFQNSAQPQSMGWKPPHKLDIDTVDNIPKFRDNGFHNFAVNMESKSTPVKNELIAQNTSKLSLKQQLLNKTNTTCTCPTKPTESQGTKKLSPIYESKKDASFGKKAVDNTKNFLQNSRKKIAALVRRKSTRKNLNLMRSIGIQTSEVNLPDYAFIRKSLFPKENLDDTFNAQLTTTINGVDRTDAISSIHSQSQDRFDFNRVVNSPKPQRSFSHKFSPAKMMKTFGQRPPENPESYRAYDSGLNGDFAIAAMNDILGNIRVRLEEVNKMTVQTLDEVAREAKEVDEVEEVEEENAHSSTQISAQADIHTEPLYAEIRERRASVSDQSVQTTEILPTTYFRQDPNVIYAEIDKSRKMPKCLSYNNLLEKDSPPKCRNMNKSDLSNSSEVFLDNLFNPKKDNSSGQYIRINLSSEDEMTSPAGTSSTAPVRPEPEDGSVRYEEPFEEQTGMSEVSFGKGSSSSRMTSPDFCHKEDSNSHQKLPVCMLHNNSGFLPERSNSCPPSSQNSALRKFSLGSDDFGNIDLSHSTSNCKSPNTSFQKYRTLKDRLKMSFRRGKKYLKNNRNRFSNAFDKSVNKVEESLLRRSDKLWDQSDLGISNLYAMDPTNEIAVKRQIEQAVNICRQMPQFESSTELVEAERLLLFSTLKSRSMKRPSPKKTPSNVKDCLLYIETFEIPVIPDVNQDTFFNYFYIGVFANGTDIKSTHSAEKRNNKVVFSDCQLLFDSLEADFQIKIDIYVLRLRKMTNAKRDKAVRKKYYNTSDSGDEILSRFRLHGSVIITADSLVPYTVHIECNRGLPKNKFCLRAVSNNYIFSISEVTRSTHLLRELRMDAKAELALKRYDLEGFINVQDDKNVHNWNRRWCKLEVLTLCFWNYPQDYSEKPCILKVDLTKCVSFPIVVADGTVCAKQRSFVIKIADRNEANGIISKDFFFAAENHVELTDWLNGLNQIGELVRKWMFPVQ